MKRAAFFTLIFFSMLMLYFIGASYNTTLIDQDKRFPVEYTPFVVWIIYMGYIFFPNREVFNP
jgi:ABC-type multidrug transport system permease subunit